MGSGEQRTLTVTRSFDVKLATLGGKESSKYNKQ